MSKRLLLASGSPRRRSLLAQLDLDFEIQVPDVDESVLSGEDPEDYVTRLALDKNAAVRKGLTDPAVILAADTTVVLDGNILGKPESKDHGLAMLRALSGRTHQVLTGVAVSNGSRIEAFCVDSAVTFRELEPAEPEHYWATGEPRDKAGAYGLQGIGAMFVSRLEGSYTNVIGLPLTETVVTLRRFGVACLGVSAGAEIGPAKNLEKKGIQHG